MESKVVLLVLSTVLLKFASSQTISCYDCDPQNYASECADPGANAVRLSPCIPDPSTLNGTSVCLSAFINVTNSAVNKTGIYRGCYTSRPDTGDFCDWFREQTQDANTTVVSCEACNATRCNTIGFRDDGTSSTQNILALSAFVLVFNAMFVILLGGKE